MMLTLGSSIDLESLKKVVEITFHIKAIILISQLTARIKTIYGWPRE